MFELEGIVVADAYDIPHKQANLNWRMVEGKTNAHPFNGHKPGALKIVSMEMAALTGSATVQFGMVRQFADAGRCNQRILAEVVASTDGCERIDFDTVQPIADGYIVVVNLRGATLKQALDNATEAMARINHDSFCVFPALLLQVCGGNAKAVSRAEDGTPQYAQCITACRAAPDAVGLYEQCNFNGIASQAERVPA